MSNTTTPPPTFGFLSSLESIHFPTGGIMLFSLISEPLNSAGLGILDWNSPVSLKPLQNPVTGQPFMGGITSTKPPLQSPPPIPLLSLKRDTQSDRPAHVEDWGAQAWFGGAPEPDSDWSSQGFVGIAQGGPQGGGLIHQSFNSTLLKFGAAWPVLWPVYWDDIIAGSWGYINIDALGVQNLNMDFVVSAAPDTAMRMSLWIRYYKKITTGDEFILTMQANQATSVMGKKPDFQTQANTNTGPAPTHIYFNLLAGPKGLTLSKTKKFGN